MRTIRRCALPMLGALGLMVFSMSQSWAIPIVRFSWIDIGEGLFRYEMTVDNTDGPEGAQGLLLFDASTIFSLDESSVIGAPQNVGGNPAADWNFFAPFPGLADQLSYFSLSPTGDIPIGGVLGGFTFESFTNPHLVDFSTVQVDLVGSNSGRDIPTKIPEPLSWLLAGLGLLVLQCELFRRRSRN